MEGSAVKAESLNNIKKKYMKICQLEIALAIFADPTTDLSFFKTASNSQENGSCGTLMTSSGALELKRNKQQAT